MADGSGACVALDDSRAGQRHGHTLLALNQGGYFPGLATAPLLLFFAGWLLVLLIRQSETAGHS